jgi:hypothetical protein
MRNSAIFAPSYTAANTRANYHRIAQQVGLVGVYSPHSLRYAFAIDKIKEMLAAGFSRNDALRATAALLGHGPSRARYVTQVYGRTIVHTLPKSKPNGREIALTELSVELAALEDEQSQAEREEGRFLEDLEVAKVEIKQLFFCKFRELVLRCCARAAVQGFIVR